jgi:hypothetical protein
MELDIALMGGYWTKKKTVFVMFFSSIQRKSFSTCLVSVCPYKEVLTRPLHGFDMSDPLIYIYLAHILQKPPRIAIAIGLCLKFL